MEFLALLAVIFGGFFLLGLLAMMFRGAQFTYATLFQGLIAAAVLVWGLLELQLV